jgi:hypothetical protein
VLLVEPVALHWLSSLSFCASDAGFSGNFFERHGSKPRQPYPLLSALVIALVVAALNIGLWWWGNLPHGPATGTARSAALRYSASSATRTVQSRFPSDEQIDAI